MASNIVIASCSGVVSSQSITGNYALTCSTEWVPVSGVLPTLSDWSSQPTLQDIFSIPLQSDLQQMWMTGFALPVSVYLVSWAYQSIINFWKMS